MSNANDDPVPRDVIALVVLHGLLSGNTPDGPYNDDMIDGYTQLAFAFADAMKKRGDK